MLAPAPYGGRRFKQNASPSLLSFKPLSCEFPITTNVILWATFRKRWSKLAPSLAPSEETFKQVVPHSSTAAMLGNRGRRAPSPCCGPAELPCDWTDKYPTIAKALAELPAKSTYLEANSAVFCRMAGRRSTSSKTRSNRATLRSSISSSIRVLGRRRAHWPAAG